MNDSSSSKVRIEYKKSHSFRVIHADGAYGGTSPRLNLFVAFYSERFPLPNVLTYETSISGAPAIEVSSERESKEGIIREMEVGVTLDLNAAKGFLSWLTEQVSELEKRREQMIGSSIMTPEIQQ